MLKINSERILAAGQNTEEEEGLFSENRQGFCLPTATTKLSGPSVKCGLTLPGGI